MIKIKIAAMFLVFKLDAYVIGQDVNRHHHNEVDIRYRAASFGG